MEIPAARESRRYYSAITNMKKYSSEICEGLIFRSARTSDVTAIVEILKGAVAWMLASGKKQWDENYPTEGHVRSDIGSGIGYVLEERGRVIAYAAVVFTGEPAYKDIKGKWLTEDPYVVVHRLAVSQQEKGRGMSRKYLQAVEAYARTRGITSFKIDTNYDNEIMLSLLSSEGFTYCGEIRYKEGTRKAFEKRI